MRRYTTPTHTLAVSGVDLSEASVWVTYRQANRVVTVEEPEVEYADGRSTITATLTEAQTAELNVGNAKVQVNWVIDGVRDATEAIAIKVTENLLESELIQSEPEGGEDGGDDESGDGEQEGGLGMGLGMGLGSTHSGGDADEGDAYGETGTDADGE